MSRELSPEEIERFAERLNAIVQEGIARKARELSELIEADGDNSRWSIPQLPLQQARLKSIDARLVWLEPWIAEMYLQALAAILKQVGESVPETPAK